MNCTSAHLFLLGGTTGLGTSRTGLLLLNALDDTDGHGLTHITDGESTKGRILHECLHAHGLGGDELDKAGIARLDKLGVLLLGLTRTTIDLGGDRVELARNVGSVAIEHRGVTVTNLTGVVEDDDLGVEGRGLLGRIVLGVTADVTTANFLDGNVLHVEPNVVTRESLGHGRVVHLDGLDLSLNTGRRKNNDHVGLEDTSLNTTDGHCTDTTDLVDILEGKAEGLVRRALGRLNGVEGLEECGTLVPRHVLRAINHVVAVPSGNGDEGDLLRVVADLFEEVHGLLLDLLITGLLVANRLVVHLVNADNELLDTEGEGQQGVLAGLTILGDTSLELTLTRGNNQNTDIGLGRSGNHVLDEVTMSGGINDGELELGSLELPQGNVDGNTTLSLGLELVENPRVLERGLTCSGCNEATIKNISGRLKQNLTQRHAN